MKKLVILPIFLISTRVFSQHKSIFPDSTLWVFFTSHFYNDSISVYTNQNRHSIRLTTQESLGLASGVSFRLRNTDSVLYVRDVLKDRPDSVRIKPGYSFVYISHMNGRFQFDFTRKPIFFE